MCVCLRQRTRKYRLICYKSLSCWAGSRISLFTRLLCSRPVCYYVCNVGVCVYMPHCTCPSPRLGSGFFSVSMSQLPVNLGMILFGALCTSADNEIIGSSSKQYVTTKNTQKHYVNLTSATLEQADKQLNCLQFGQVFFSLFGLA